MEQKKVMVNEAKQKPLTVVKTVRVGMKTLIKSLTLTGILKSNQELEIISETEGKITELKFELNQKVVEGQVLAKTYAETKMVQYQIADLNFKKAKRDFERYEALFKNNNLSEFELENARFQMQNTQQNLILAQHLVDFTSIKSPINGTVTQKLVTNGKVLTLGSPIAVITDISKLKLFVNISPVDINIVKVGQKVSISIPDRQNEQFIGIIKSISVQSNQAGSYPIEICMENNLKKPLLAGMNAQVVFTENHLNQVLVIPRLAVDGNKVWVVENNVAIEKIIKCGVENGEYIEIVNGLTPGDQVIIMGQNNITNNQLVKIRN